VQVLVLVTSIATAFFLFLRLVKLFERTTAKKDLAEEFGEEKINNDDKRTPQTDPNSATARSAS
jgi:hypothetical protein